MAKRGSTRPHSVKFEYSNGVKGTEPFGSAEEAVAFMDKLDRTAASREMTVTSERYLRTAGSRSPSLLQETRGKDTVADVEEPAAVAPAAPVSTVKVLGPRQQNSAKMNATHLWLWADDLRKAIDANDVATAETLLKAITDTSARISTTLRGARAHKEA
jgi:hypothetical protein